MRRFFAVFIFSLCLSVTYAADVRDMFISMPDSVLPLLSSVNRLDMLDFYDSGMKAAVRNRLDGESELTYISPKSIKIRYTGSSEVVIRLFYYKDSVPVICLARTYESNGLYDSRIGFYDSKWQELDASRILQIPEFDAFVRDGLSKDSVAYIRNASEIRSIKACLPDDSDRIEFEYTGLAFAGEDSLQCASCLRKEPIVYDWNGKRFVMRKNRK